MNKIFLLLLLVLSVSMNAQQVKQSQSIILSNEIKTELDDKFKKYEVITLPQERLLAQLDEFEGVHEITLNLGKGEIIPLQLTPDHDLIDRQVVTLASRKKVESKLNHVYPYKGHVVNGTAYARVTIAEGMFYGYIQGDDFNRFIEPLRYVIPGADPNLYLTYYGDDVNYPTGDFCAAQHLKSQKLDSEVIQKSSQVGDCFEAELGLASDFSMFQKYTDAAGVIARNVGVMNNVQGNYDDEFADEVQFVIVEQFVSDCSTCDPWTNSTDSGVLLSDFRNWGPNGFSEVHDVGHLWTDRDFDGTTIGLAYVGVICSGFRYAVLQDFSNNAGLTRVLTSHEMGHNFDASHDGAGSDFIMAPAVSNATNWSGASIADIEAHYLSRNCLATCAPPAPPVTDFFANLTNICPGATIQFFDNSQNAPTSWNWTFSGGSPGSSTMENPMVTYENPGMYNVILESSNESGSNTQLKTGYIIVGSDGVEFVFSDDFINNLANWTVTNPDNSTTWQTGTISGSSGNSTVAWINNHGYDDGAGDVDGLESPVIDMTGRATGLLELEYAYARYNAQFNDRMRIVVSTDGGNSFPNEVYNELENGSGNHATRPQQTAAFTPEEAADWCVASSFGPGCISIDLSAFADEEQVVVRIENISGYGNNLYIDNVNFSASCVVLGPPVANFTSDLQSGCAPLVVQYQDLTTNGPDAWSWTFPGGTPASSNEQNPLVTYNIEGVYPVNLVVSNEQGSNSVTVETYVNVLDVPAASFTEEISGTTVEFTNTTIGGDSYNWDFGDNSNSSQENPIHVYAEDGTYEVSLTVGNVCGSHTIVSTIVISNLPLADFSQDNSGGCAIFEVQFTDASSSNTDSYSWTFEGGNPSSSTEENPVVTYSERGVYDVILVVTNEEGSDELIKEDAVTVNDVPETSFSHTIDVSTVTFENTSNYADSYVWDFGDGEMSTEVNPIHTYDSDEVFDVTLTATNECGESEIVEMVTISNLPFANFTVASQVGCIPFEVQYNNSSSSNSDSYFWVFEGGTPATSTEENPVVMYSVVGSYDVQLTVSNEEGMDMLSIDNYITVGDAPTAFYSSTSDQLEYDSVNQSTDGDQFAWNFGDGEMSNEENPSHTYEIDGSYIVELMVTNACGTDVYETEVNVVSAVTAGFSTNVTTGCADLVVQYSNSSSSNVDSYSWSFPGGSPSSSTEANPSITYTEAGLFDVTLIVSNQEYTDELIMQSFVDVRDVPDVDFSFDFTDLTVQFENMTVNGETFEWDFGDGDMSDQENPVHTYAEFGDYEVTLIASNECGEETLVETVNVSSLPTANFESNTTSGCTVAEVMFEDLSSSNSDTWEWIFEGGTPATSTEQNPTISYENVGIFDVSLTVSNESGSDTYTLEDYITIQSLPIVDITSEVVGNVANFEVESSNTDEYVWTSEATNEMFFGVNPNISFPADGVYTIILEATNECGTITTSTAINITAFPDADFSSSLQIGCAPANIQFEDDSDDDPTTFMWSFEGGTPAVSNEQNPAIFYESPGSYQVQLIVGNDVGEDTLVQETYIVLEEGPTADFEFSVVGVEVEFTNTSIGEGDVSWNFGEGGMSLEENPTYSYTSMGDYTVQLIIDNGGNCVDTIEQVVSILVDNVYETEAVSFNLYPNPNRGQFSLEILSDVDGKVNFSILNIVGQKLMKGQVDADGVTVIDTDLIPGVYFMELKSNKKKGVIRFVVN